MFKKIVFLFLLFLAFFNPSNIFAQNNNFVSIVNPIRGNDFWELKNQSVETAVLGQVDILKQFNLNPTWLLRFDVLDNQTILKSIENFGEKGLFLEITPTWTTKAEVSYRSSFSWHAAGSAFLTGYEQPERIKLIDSAFEKFKSVFGDYPKSVGAWWVDAFSISYMYEKYKITSVLIVADQYSTDNYQIWGQYFQTPYYPDKFNALHPAQSNQNKIPVVITQWATRDPVNGYGSGVLESTFSVQANDYIDYHNLNIDYFKKLIQIYINQPHNLFSQIVVGLENTYDWGKYSNEYKNQIEFIASSKNIKVLSLNDFSTWYKQNFPNLSPQQIIVADDPLGSFKKVVWFMNPYYRVGWFYNSEGSLFRDIRQYVGGEKELCFEKKCDSVNFATQATRVLDEVSFGHKWIIDKGRISDFNVSKIGEKYVLSYKNEAGNQRQIEFLPRDISVDGKVSSIDTTILNSTKENSIQTKEKEFVKGKLFWDFPKLFLEIIKLLIFLAVAILIPGLNLVKKLENEPVGKRIFLGITLGIVGLTTIFYVASILNLRILVYLYILINLFIFYKSGIYKSLTIKSIKGFKLVVLLVVLAGTIFQVIPSLRNGLVYSYGIGFWGPNTHDGIWHISLINQLVKGVPPQNPIFSDTLLKNYHFFYDLLVASSVYLTGSSVLDLVFRFYPFIFSLLLGVGTYYLYFSLVGKVDTKAKIGVIISLYFVYFAGSFGWIVEYIKSKTLAGESAFWANQSISFNLNPPFAISLIIVIAILLLLSNIKTKLDIFIMILLAGTLVAFKSYAAILILVSFFVVGVIRKNAILLLTFLVSAFLNVILVVTNFNIGNKLISFSPFWFIHSMIDSPDRVGWTRLTLTRTVGLESKNWFKFIGAEVIGFLIFILGNLGMRFFSLFALVRIKNIFQNTQTLFIFVFSTAAFLIPILFIQEGNPWNTIQFSYYGLYTTALVSAVVLTALISKLPKFISAVFLLFVLLLTPINSITTATYYLGDKPHGLVTTQELEGLNFLKNQPYGVVLTYPYDGKLKKTIKEPWPLFVYDSTAYVSALSSKQVFIEDEPQNQILLTPYQKRVVSSSDFFLTQGTRGRKFLENNKISFIYIPKRVNISIDESSLNLKTIFENEETKIFKVLN